MKIFAKILIVAGLAAVLGRILVSYTTRGQERYSSLQQNTRSLVLEALNAEPRDQITQEFDESHATGTISDLQDELDREFSDNPDKDGVVISS